MTNNKGPSIDPCGTPEFAVKVNLEVVIKYII